MMSKRILPKLPSKSNLSLLINLFFDSGLLSLMMQMSLSHTFILEFYSFLDDSLEKVLKADDKVVDVKKALLKKREEEIVKETKAAADKKVTFQSTSGYFYFEIY